MDFDEYDYLEKTVENPDLAAVDNHPASNGGGSASRSEKERSKSSRHRDGGGDESDRRSKRSRSEDRSGGSKDHHERHRDKERDRERERESSSRHRDRSSPDRREKERHKDRERDEKDRERDGGREKEGEKERSRERDREREKDKEREKERERRSRSQSERRRDEEGERHREKSKEKEFRDRDARRYREKKEAAEPEADPERDQRTVFAYQLPLKADERDCFEFFSRAGKVRDVRLIMDRNSRRSKGVGYIEFYDAMSVPMAIALSGQLLLGQPVMVKPSEAEKNLVQSTATAGATGANAGVARRLYVGNLHLNINEDQLRQVFESFGQVELVQLPLDPLTGLCKGYGFIQFARLEDARAAQSLNGQLEIAGRTIKVSAVTDQTGTQDATTNAGDLDDDEGGGLSLNARSRALLMQKLDRTGTASSVVGALASPAGTAPILAVPTVGAPLASLMQPVTTSMPGLVAPGLLANANAASIGVPSECLLLNNMFDPNIETEPDFDLDIKDDVEEECSKFGTVKHIFVDRNTAGFVYLRFDSVASAVKAQAALHGRWFAGKMITARYLLPSEYEAKFPGKS